MCVCLLEIKVFTHGFFQIWVGKDYSNPVKRDFFQVHQPYEGAVNSRLMHTSLSFTCSFYLLLYFKRTTRTHADSVDRESTPRMPWHDVSGCVAGEAARDIARHFIQRWNWVKVRLIFCVIFCPLYFIITLFSVDFPSARKHTRTLPRRI